MNIASVPWRCGHSWTVPGSGRRVAARRRAAAPRRPPARVGPGRQHGLDHPGRLGEHRRAGRVEHHAARAGPSRGRGAAAPAAAAPGRRGRPGCRRQRPRAAGAARPARCTGRRRAPGRRCRAGHAGRVPSPVTTPSTPSAPRQRAPDQPGAVRLPLVGEQPGALRSAASAASRAALPPGPAHRSSQRSSRPVDRRRGQGERDQLGALVLDAGPALGDRRDRAGVARRRGATPYGDQRVGLARAAPRRVDRPGPGHQRHPGRLVVGGQQRLELVLADRPARALDDPARMGVRTLR